jgi:hypothetical protein
VPVGISFGRMQDAEIISEIEDGFVKHIERLRKFRKVEFDISTKSGSTRTEVSFENENFMVIQTPILNKEHYVTSVFGCNSDYAFRVGKTEESDSQIRMKSITPLNRGESRHDDTYSYGQKLRNAAESGMIIVPEFCPFTCLRLSEPQFGMKSVTISPSSSDSHVLTFEPKFVDLTDDFGSVCRLSTIKYGRITFSKQFGFLPVEGELHMEVALSKNTTQNWIQKMEWAYEPFGDGFRLASYVQYRPDMPVESRLAFTNFKWETALRPDEFRITRFGFEEPEFVKSGTMFPGWLWIIAVGLLMLLVSFVLYKKRK